MMKSLRVNDGSSGDTVVSLPRQLTAKTLLQKKLTSVSEKLEHIVLLILNILVYLELWSKQV